MNEAILKKNSLSELPFYITSHHGYSSRTISTNLNNPVEMREAFPLLFTTSPWCGVVYTSPGSNVGPSWRTIFYFVSTFIGQSYTWSSSKNSGCGCGCFQMSPTKGNPKMVKNVVEDYNIHSRNMALAMTVFLFSVDRFVSVIFVEKSQESWTQNAGKPAIFVNAATSHDLEILWSFTLLSRDFWDGQRWRYKVASKKNWGNNELLVPSAYIRVVKSLIPI